MFKSLRFLLTFRNPTPKIRGFPGFLVRKVDDSRNIGVWGLGVVQVSQVKLFFTEGHCPMGDAFLGVFWDAKHRRKALGQPLGAGLAGTSEWLWRVARQLLPWRGLPWKSLKLQWQCHCKTTKMGRKSSAFDFRTIFLVWAAFVQGHPETKNPHISKHKSGRDGKGFEAVNIFWGSILRPSTQLGESWIASLNLNSTWAMFVPVLTFPCLTGHHCKGLKKSGLWQCKQLQCKRPVDRSLMEPGIMVNRWCHLCPGGLAVWKRSVLVGVQSFCFTCSNSLFLDVFFFFFGRFWPILVPCGFIFSSWEAAGETHLPSSQRNLRSLQFFGGPKKDKTPKTRESSV